VGFRQAQECARLVELMLDTAAHELRDDIPMNESVELRAIPINSRTMRAFLVAVDDSFDRQWTWTPLTTFSAHSEVLQIISSRPVEQGD
jgi:hypothetical protein